MKACPFRLFCKHENIQCAECVLFLNEVGLKNVKRMINFQVWVNFTVSEYSKEWTLAAWPLFTESAD